MELVIGPRFGNILGGTAVHLTGPCFDQMDLLICSFDDEKESVLVLNNRTAICVSPRFEDIGWKSLTLSIIRDGQEIYSGQNRFYASMLHRKDKCGVLINLPRIPEKVNIALKSNSFWYCPGFNC